MRIMAWKYVFLMFIFLFFSPILAQETCTDIISEESVELFPSFLSPDPVANAFLSNIINFINNTLLCVSVGDDEVEILLDTLALYLCNGAIAEECEVAQLNEASSLLIGDKWKDSKEVVLFIPGWTNSPTSQGYSTEVIDAYATNGSYNLLILDWYSINNLEYTKTVALVPYVSERVAAHLDDLSAASEGFSRLHLVGHSLGAHVAGGIARKLGSALRPSTIAALDPAGPLFYKSSWKCQDPVTSIDADYVVALHSDWGRFGGNELVGDVDLMPNGGHFIQPGCNANDENPACGNKTLCSHERALMLWSDAVRRPGTLLARKCASESSFDAGACALNPSMDVTQPTTNYGTYYFTTNGEIPYGKGTAGI